MKSFQISVIYVAIAHLFVVGCSGAKIPEKSIDKSNAKSSYDVAWPSRKPITISNGAPTIISGTKFGTIVSTFHVESYNPQTTNLRGFIELHNESDQIIIFPLCVEDGAITYHIRMRNTQGEKVYRHLGVHHNWSATEVKIGPQEKKKEFFEVDLKDYFELDRGSYQLLFVYDLRMLKSASPDAPMRNWSLQSLAIRCDFQKPTE